MKEFSNKDVKRITDRIKELEKNLPDEKESTEAPKMGLDKEYAIGVDFGDEHQYGAICILKRHGSLSEVVASETFKTEEEYEALVEKYAKEFKDAYIVKETSKLKNWHNKRIKVELSETVEFDFSSVEEARQSLYESIEEFVKTREQECQSRSSILHGTMEKIASRVRRMSKAFRNFQSVLYFASHHKRK